MEVATSTQEVNAQQEKEAVARETRNQRGDAVLVQSETNVVIGTKDGTLFSNDGGAT
jgi:hypothetical protein